MKHSLILSLMLPLALALGCRESSTARVEASAPTLRPEDEIAIRQVIENETMAFVNRDSILLMSFYADDEITQTAWNNPDGTFGQFRGKRRISDNIRKVFNEHPERQHLPEIERVNWVYKPLSRDWMWVNFIQKMTTTDGERVENYETRLMKREEGAWKIAVMFALSHH